MIEAIWLVRLSDRASNDYSDILEWTTSRFGETQARNYEDILADAISKLRGGPDAIGTRARPDLGRRIHALRPSRPGRHIVFFRIVSTENRIIEVVCILHDAMDPSRHLPSQ